MKNNLFPSNLAQSRSVAKTKSTEVQTIVKVEDMEIAHSSSTAKFDEVEVLSENSHESVCGALLSDDEAEAEESDEDQAIYYIIKDSSIEELLPTDEANIRMTSKRPPFDDEQDEDILEMSMYVLNTLVQKTHDRVEKSRLKKCSGRRVSSKIKEKPSSKLSAIPQSATVTERRTTRGLKIDFAKLHSYEDVGYNGRVDYENTIMNEARCSSGNIAKSGAAAAAKKRKAEKDLRVKSKLARRDSVPESENEGAIANQLEEYAEDGNSQFCPVDSLQECSDPAICVCVACDPKMDRLRQQNNYLNESDFYKMARYVHLLRNVDNDEDELFDQQQDITTSSSSDEDSPGSASQTESPTDINNSGSAVSRNPLSVSSFEEYSQLPRFECAICDLKCSTPQQLQQHVATHEFKGGKGPISSRYCPFSLRLKSCLSIVACRYYIHVFLFF